MTTSVIIAAAGTGERVGGKTPKQYMQIGSIPILVRSAYAFLDRPDIDRVVIIIHQSHYLHYQNCMPYFANKPKLSPHVIGGDTRGKSVYNGLCYLAENNPPDRVIVHDAARPLVRSETIDNVMAALAAGHKAVVPVLPIHDATYITDDNGNIAPMPMTKPILTVQTPQGFDFKTLYDAYRVMKTFQNRDEATAAIDARVTVHSVTGDTGNYKITTAQDLERATRDINSGTVTGRALCM